MRWAFTIFCYLWRSKQYAMMDLKTIRTELHKLTSIVDGWEPSGHIPALERDLALEKLRALYDAVRFAEGASDTESPVAEEEPAAAAPVAIDLGAVLSLDPADESGFEAEPDAEVQPAFEAEPEPAGEFSEPDTTAGPEPDEVFTVPEPEAEPSEMPEPVVSESAVPEPESEPEVESVPVLVAEEAEPVDPVAEPVPAPEPVEEPAPAPEPAIDPAPAAEPAPEPVAQEKPQYVAPTLFGMEDDETVRHRHKQRVIMSLYDTPAPAEKPAKPEVAEVRPEPVVTPEPAVMPMEPERQRSEPREPQPVAAPVVPAVAPVSEPEFGDDEPDFEEIEVTAPAGAVLGDVINHDVQTLADTIAPQRGATSELRRGEPVTDLRRAIGINDKFLLIRDLFGGDGSAYEEAIGALNAFEDFDECMIYIAENYAWNPNSDGAKFMMELLERKFA